MRNGFENLVNFSKKFDFLEMNKNRHHILECHIKKSSKSSQ